MKKLKLISLIILGQILTMNAQWGGTDPITTNSDVGIGLSGVDFKLSIYKAGQAPSTTIGNGIMILDSDGGVANTFGVNTSGSNYTWIQARNVEGSTTYTLSLNPLGGNVGVGLTAPTSKLHSAGQISTGIPLGGLGGASATTGSLLFYNSSNTMTVGIQSGATTPLSYTWTLPLAQGAASTVLTNDGSGVLSWSNPNTGIASTAWLLTGNTLTGTLPASPTEFIGTINASDWVVKTNNAERMRVVSGGNVGIGTSSPSSKLHVNDGYIYISDPATAHGMTSIVPTDVIGTIGKNNASGGLTVTGLNEDGTGNGLSLIGYIGAGSASNPAVRFMGAVKSGTTFTVVPDNDLLFTVTNSNSNTRLALQGNGFMGLGTTTPAVKLDVSGSINLASGYNLTWGGAHAANIPTIAALSGSTSYIEFYPAGSSSTNTKRVRIDNTGNVGIGTTAPNYKLDVQLATTSTVTVAINTNGVVNATNYTTTSDKMFKKDIDSLQNALATIHQLKPKSYYYDTSKYNGVGKFAFQSVKQYGFIAQEVETILPELISYSVKPAILDTLGNVVNPEYTYRALNYNALISILTKGIQELDVSIAKSKQEQKETTDSLMINSAKQDSTINSQNAKIAELQNQISNCCSKIILDKGLLNNTNNATSTNNTDTLSVSTPVLYQNNPNPFNQQTSIEYFIPTNAKSAIIMVFDLNGKLINTIPVTNFGIGAITINGNELYPGMFIYSLIVDEKIIDTKRMILTH